MAAGALSISRRHAVEAILVASAHFALMLVSLAVVCWSNGVAAIWPCNAVLVAYLLMRPRRTWPVACALVFLGCLAASLTVEGRGQVALPFAIANIFESIVVAALTIRIGGRAEITAPKGLFAFIGATLAGVGGSASIAAAALALTSGTAFGPAWLSWFAADALGLLTLVPLLVVGIRAASSRTRPQPRRVLLGTGALGLVLLASLAVFLQESLPLLFLIAPTVLLATFTLRGVGAATATIIVVVVGASAMALDSGPVSALQAAGSARLTLLQVFFATTFLTSLPVAAILGERDRMSRRLAEREAQFRAVADAVSDVLFRTDKDGRWTYLNPAWEALSGHLVADTIGQSFLHHVVEEDREPLLERLKGLESGIFSSIRHQFRFRTAAGEERWGEVQASRLNDADGEIVGSAGTIVDISDRLALAALVEEGRRQAEREAQAALRLAATDELTGVASRRAFLAHLDQFLAKQQPLSIALFDVDHFKSVNDRHGHPVGDEVLRGVAQIAAHCVREGDLVGRLGGEEFAVLMPGASLEQAVAVGERLRLACAEAVHASGVTVTISVGVATAGEATTSSALLREADAALYRAKYEGRNCLRKAA